MKCGLLRKNKVHFYWEQIWNLTPQIYFSPSRHFFAWCWRETLVHRTLALDGRLKHVWARNLTGSEIGRYNEACCWSMWVGLRFSREDNMLICCLQHDSFKGIIWFWSRVWQHLIWKATPTHPGVNSCYLSCQKKHRHNRRSTRNNRLRILFATWRRHRPTCQKSLNRSPLRARLPVIFRTSWSPWAACILRGSPQKKMHRVKVPITAQFVRGGTSFRLNSP